MCQPYGIVLCGGGAKGAYQMGVLKALEEKGYLNNIFGISGVSIGALNALAISCCGTDIGIEMWDEINPSVVFDTDITMIDGTEGLFSRQKMRELLYRYIKFEKIQQTTYPIYVTTAPVEASGCLVEYFKINDKSKDEIVTLMEATSALPIIYKDVDFDGVKYRDGGICDNMPIRPLYDLGCREFFVLSLSNEATINQIAFPDARFHLLRPYKDLGGLLTGTLNFSKEDIQMNLKLGYKDGIRYVKAYLEGDTLISDHYDLYATMDYDSVALEMRQQEMQKSIDSKFEYIANLEKKYNIDF
ncbi:MAG: patatin-like phospholipase family protein [Eubacteriales bacterium]|nr:patatin-like phospholipase family protein [Eubacteriales bacterium]